MDLRTEFFFRRAGQLKKGLLGLTFLSIVFASFPTILPGETKPHFLRFGKTLEFQVAEIPRRDLKKYANALDRFPNLSSCINPDVRDGDFALPAMNWSVIRSLHEAEVCIFWIAWNFSEIGEFRNWLANNNFSVSEQMTVSPARMRWKGWNQSGFLLTARQPIKNLEMNLGWSELLGAHSLSIGVYARNTGKPVHINVIINRK